MNIMSEHDDIGVVHVDPLQIVATIMPNPTDIKRLRGLVLIFIILHLRAVVEIIACITTRCALFGANSHHIYLNIDLTFCTMD